MTFKTIIMRRIFAAIHIHPEPFLTELLSKAKMHFGQDSVRWANPQQLHLTLKFFGETSETTISDIRMRLREACEMHSAFQFRLQGVGVFGSRYQPRVIWIGTSDDDRLRSLSKDLLEASAKAGFPVERLPFVPHLTIGRISHIGNKKRLTDWVSGNKMLTVQSVAVTEVILFESILKPTGAVYSVIETFQLSLQ